MEVAEEEEEKKKEEETKQREKRKPELLVENPFSVRRNTRHADLHDYREPPLQFAKLPR